MKEILLIFITAAIIFMSLSSVLRRNGKSRAEMEALTVLLYMFSAQKGSDANGMLFKLERYAGVNRKMINNIRTGYLKNDAGNVRPECEKKHEKVFLGIMETLYENGHDRTLELMDGLGELKKRNMERAARMRGEIVNSAGIVFTMIIMFLIIIYFLAPYTRIFSSYGI